MQANLHKALDNFEQVTHITIQYNAMLQWAQLNGITLGTRQTDPYYPNDTINRHTLWSTDCNNSKQALDIFKKMFP
jgi:hypothetical protein